MRSIISMSLSQFFRFIFEPAHLNRKAGTGHIYLGCHGCFANQGALLFLSFFRTMFFLPKRARFIHDGLAWITKIETHLKIRAQLNNLGDGRDSLSFLGLRVLLEEQRSGEETKQRRSEGKRKLRFSKFISHPASVRRHATLNLFLWKLWVAPQISILKHDVLFFSRKVLA